MYSWQAYNGVTTSRSFGSAPAASNASTCVRLDCTQASTSGTRDSAGPFECWPGSGQRPFLRQLMRTTSCSAKVSAVRPLVPVRAAMRTRDGSSRSFFYCFTVYSLGRAVTPFAFSTCLLQDACFPLVCAQGVFGHSVHSEVARAASYPFSRGIPRVRAGCLRGSPGLGVRASWYSHGTLQRISMLKWGSSSSPSW